MIELKDELVRMRKDSHRFPELGFKEYRTAEKAAGYMKNLGFVVHRGTGVVGLFIGKEAQPALGIRACVWMHCR